MVSPLAPNVLPKVLVNYATMATVYDALAQVLPPELLKPDGRAYVDALEPNALNDGVRRMSAMVRDLTDRGLLGHFRSRLAQLDPGNTVLGQLLSDSLEVDKNGRVAEAALESIRRGLEIFIDTEAELEILNSGPRVCAILVKGKIEGTGFLVGPDLVMTARHVIKDLLDVVPGVDATDLGKDEEKDSSAAKLACVFDYVGTLYKPFPLDPPPPGMTIEKVAAKWLEWSSREHRKDGIGHQFDNPPDIRTLFDCAVIRLARPVGNAATDKTGSKTRGWIKLEDELDDPTPGQRLVLLQHPGEGPRKKSEGNLMLPAPGGTRIWYSAGAAGGSSGAPCFDSQCRVVAFHNAGYPTQPEPDIDTGELNQGVPLAPVLKALPRPLLDEVKGKKPPPATLWSLGEEIPDKPGVLHPVLGRTDLQQWIATMAGPAPAKRVIVVEEAESDEAVGTSGKSFSTRILRAMMLGRPGVVIQLEAEKIKDLEPDAFLTDLAHQASIYSADLPMPAKPTEERQLTRWWANDLPNWFALLVEEGAQRMGALSRGAATDGAEEEALVLAPIWIAIDDIDEVELSTRMQECLAGLIGITESTTTIAPGLAALRWLIIGNVPDFIREQSIEHEHEEVAQGEVGEADCLDCFKAAFQAEGLADKYDEDVAKMIYDLSIGSKPEVAAATPHPTYLPTLAIAAGDAIAAMLKKARK